ncbi:hypothetical protein AVEN_256504-1 [Araneus ventricosus]|uniref:Uncharacterized protein n=1 Tax=Araneus ventricosus TaxID=182803 RepID=A0A4Y2QV04_ARAVE|nr:hypothetical protein AVEN_256504-1 [Araneus ventricosus]
MQDMRKESEFAIENNSQKSYVIHNRNSNIVDMNDRVKMNASLPTEVDTPTLLGRDSMSIIIAPSYQLIHCILKLPFNLIHVTALARDLQIINIKVSVNR